MALFAAAGPAPAAAVAAYDPPHSLAAAPTAEAGSAALMHALPADAQLRFEPLQLPFGGHRMGWLLGFRVATPMPGDALWYLTPDPATPGQWLLLRLRDPQLADADLTSRFTAAAALGPEGAKDIVLLETISRAAPAGGAQAAIGTVYRRRGPAAEVVAALSPLLDGVADVESARQRLAAAHASLLPQPGSAVAEAFASLPLQWLPLTRLERLERLQRGHPLHAVHDGRNGYLATRGDAGEPAYVAALFRHADGALLLGLQRRYTRTQETRFLLRAGAGGEWRDVSAAVMPQWRPGKPYVLPRQGRSVTLEAGSGAWQWDGRRFVPR
jgi:hypothetical protein